MIKEWYVHKYDIRQEYAGPEEGGRYFKSGEPTGFTLGPIESEENATDQCYALNMLERERQKREEDYPYNSVLAYKSTHYEYDVSENAEATPFPDSVPHYE